jgi:hypothetical protein
MVGGSGVLVFVHCCCFFGLHLQQPVLGGHHNPGWGGAPPVRRARLRSLLQTKIYTTLSLYT